jgi:hypothetical protein
MKEVNLVEAHKKNVFVCFGDVDIVRCSARKFSNSESDIPRVLKVADL